MIITILGPTATGKTRLSAELAHKIGAEIVSADSRQVYRRMDIGTGKDLEDYTIDGQQIPFHLIDIVEPGVEYNVFQYQQFAQNVINQIINKGKHVILCGGSGMYIEALLKGYKLFPVPDNPELRQQLETLSDEQLTEMLASFKTLHNHTDTCERPRLLRAIEIEIYYGQHPELMECCKPLNSIVFGLCGERNLIRTRITRRLKSRLEEGMIEEVDALIKSGVNPNQLVRYGLEYKFLTLYLQGEIDYATMYKKLNTAIHQFSKRQMTWFRKMERDGFDIHWIDVETPLEDKINFMLRTCNLK
ncbi:MAG: tRNA (adenosine(37)-N6)-dimethylallyltransferase MiaA [Bacteroidales bacterium]|nr:tRNA (adenosine(37)-N6)-dimethylallyltransferase MiaA [Bacteroidales bacterium]